MRGDEGGWAYSPDARVVYDSPVSPSHRTHFPGSRAGAGSTGFSEQCVPLPLTPAAVIQENSISLKNNNKALKSIRIALSSVPASRFSRHLETDASCSPANTYTENI